MAEQEYTPTEADMIWVHTVKRMHDGADRSTAKAEAHRGIEVEQ